MSNSAKNILLLCLISIGLLFGILSSFDKNNQEATSYVSDICDIVTPIDCLSVPLIDDSFFIFSTKEKKEHIIKSEKLFYNAEDRRYTPNVIHLGKQYKTLRIDESFANQVVDENTIYDIRYDFSLGTPHINDCYLANKLTTIKNDNYYFGDEIILDNNKGLYLTNGCVLLDECLSEVVMTHVNTSGESITVRIANEKSGTYSYGIFDVISIPKGCVLKFNGGKLCNGILFGNDSTIEAESETIFDSSVDFGGTWFVPQIFSEWNSNSDLKKLIHLSNDNVNNEIYISNRVFKAEFSRNGETFFDVPSNTTIYFEGEIYVVPNNLTHYSVFRIKDKDNVYIYGDGKIIGDKKYHTGMDGEYGHAFLINSSRNVEIKGCIDISNMWGDGVVIGGESISSNVKIDGLHISYCRRNGISVVNAKNSIIQNCIIDHIGGTSPHSGVDIEPMQQYGQSVFDLLIDNCTIHSCFCHGIMTYNTPMNLVKDVKISNCKIYENGTDGVLLYGSQSITLDNVYVYSISNNNSPIRFEKAQKTTFNNCIISSTSALLVNRNFDDLSYKVVFNNTTFNTDIWVSRADFFNCTIKGFLESRYSNYYSSDFIFSSPRSGYLALAYSSNFQGGKFYYNGDEKIPYWMEIVNTKLLNVKFEAPEMSLVNYLFSSTSTGISYAHIYISDAPKNALSASSNVEVVVSGECETEDFQMKKGE